MKSSLGRRWVVCGLCLWGLACSDDARPEPKPNTSKEDAAVGGIGDGGSREFSHDAGTVQVIGDGKSGFTLKDLGAGRCVAVNSHGDVLGVAEDNASFVIANGQKRKVLPRMEASAISIGIAIDDAGNVLGYSEAATGRTAIRFDVLEGAWKPLPLETSWSAGLAIGDAGELLGTLSGGELGVSSAFLVRDGKRVALPLSSTRSSAAHAMRAGYVAGIFETDQDETHAFVYDGRKLRDLGTLGGALSSAYAVNSFGDVAGGALTGGGETHAFVVTRGGAMVDYGMPKGAVFSDARGIDDLGRAAGNTRDENGIYRPVVFEKPGASSELLPEQYVSGHVAAMSTSGYVVGWGVPADTSAGAMHCLLWTPEGK